MLQTYPERKYYLVYLAALFVIVQIISQLTPPFQSPDEPNHLKRAYLLYKGEILLRSQNDITGGAIDTGLLRYMDAFSDLRFHAKTKVSAETVKLSNEEKWTGQREFSELPNTAYYFPLSYTPQALALAIGEALDLRISTSYKLARFFSLAATLGLLGLAFLAAPAPPMVLALFAIPMTLFQLASASLDAVSFALTAFIAALYVRGTDTSETYTRKMHLALTIALFALVTTRINLLPLTLLPLAVYWKRRDKLHVVSTLLLVVLSVTWVLYNLKTVHGMPARQLTTFEIIQFYADHPSQFFHIIAATLTNYHMLGVYAEGFVGVLGWLDAPLPIEGYLIIAGLLVWLAVITFNANVFRAPNANVIVLTTLGLASAALIFIMMLFTWTEHPATIIQGPQGRYFTPIAIILSFAALNKKLNAKQFRFTATPIYTILFVSTVFTVTTLIFRYYLSVTTG
ncbi:membrane protein [Methylogaea oryzae]|uniref:Membrane protein n=2 Tax=Methylogaea oryzae TaxID=1295382 RepID=A0A8D5AM42_9GAMM|nr:membrane protein [Methylogaea oryzae]